MTEGTNTDLAWSTALQDGARGLKLLGYSEATINRVKDHVGRFSRECGGCLPWDVTAIHVTAFLESLSGARKTRYSYVSSLATFYRWAAKAGRVDNDPTATTVHRLEKNQPPMEWREPLKSWTHYMRAQALSPYSIKLHLYDVTRCSREMPNEGPWSVTGTDLVEWMSRHRWSSSTARHVRTALRDFYAWAVAVKYTETNPAASLPRVKQRHVDKMPCPIDAYHRALSSSGNRERLMLRIAGELGLRRSEVAQVHRSDLVMMSDGWWLRVNGKGQRTRYVPMSSSLAEDMLIRFEASPEWLFEGQIDGHISGDRVGVLCAKALPSGIAMHSLRHMFATQAYAATNDLLSVQTLLGHADPATTQVYVRTSPTQLRKVADAART